MQRRRFLGVLSLAGLVGLTGGVQAQQSGLADDEYSAAPTWVGPASARLPADSAKFDNLRGRIVYIAEDTGEVWSLTTGDSEWTTISRPRQAVVVISKAGQLPAPSGGVSTLTSGTTYLIDGLVDIQNAGIDTVDVNGATLRGTHPGSDTLLTTGTSTLLRTRGSDCFLARLGLSAPSAQLLDLDAQDDSAALANKQLFLMDTCSVVDADDLGLIQGYRAQSFKGNAFDTYRGGMSHSGTTQKVLYDGCFFINAGDDVDAITFAAALQTDVVDMAGNYFLGFGTTPTVLDVALGPLDGGDNPVQVAADYVRNFHDETISQSDILSGIDTTTERWNFQSSAPLPDSAVLGDYSLDTATTTTISTQDTYTPVAGTTITGTTERWTQAANNEFRYDAIVSEVVSIDAKLSLEAPNTTIAVAIEYHDGTSWSVLQQSEMSYQTGGGGSPIPAPTSANQRFDTDDKFRVVVKDIDGTNDITVNQMNVMARGK